MYKYKKTKLNGKRIYSHRKVWTLAHGEIPKGYVIHHINGDSKDNRLDNLAMMTKEAHHAMHDKDRIGNPSSLREYYKTHRVWNKGTSKKNKKIRDWHKRTIETRTKNYLVKCKEFYERYKSWVGTQIEFCRNEGIDRNTLYWRLEKIGHR